MGACQPAWIEIIGVLLCAAVSCKVREVVCAGMFVASFD